MVQRFAPFAQACVTADQFVMCFLKQWIAIDRLAIGVSRTCIIARLKLQRTYREQCFQILPLDLLPPKGVRRSRTLCELSQTSPHSSD